jgi:hypothetical protein
MPAPTKPVAEDTEAASTERAEGQKKRKLTKLSSARGRKKSQTQRRRRIVRARLSQATVHPRTRRSEPCSCRSKSTTSSSTLSHY